MAPRLDGMLRLILLSAAFLVVAPRAASALVLREPTVEVTKGNPVVTSHVVRNGDELVACAAKGRAGAVKARVAIRWDRRGKARSIVVKGGTMAFRRCAKEALAGTLPITKRRAGSGSASFVVRKPAAAPAKPAAPDLQACQVDSDCTIHYQLHACVVGDPIAVNKTDSAAVYKTYPVRRLDCGMGGPQYDELRRSVENRWSARCEASRCVVHDAGSQP
jgi:hypothetical protein